LREQLLIESPGDSFAYLTDFKFDPAIFPQLDGCDQIVCEAQYRHDDIDLATKNHHSTTQQVATLAKLANVDQLTLFHLSERYRPSEWLEMLKEAQQIFPKTQFPAHWEIVESP